MSTAKHRRLAILAGTAFLLLASGAHAQEADPAESLRELFKNMETEGQAVSPDEEVNEALVPGPVSLTPPGVEDNDAVETMPDAPMVPEAESPFALPPEDIPTNKEEDDGSSSLLPAITADTDGSGADTNDLSADATETLPRVSAPSSNTLDEISNLKGDIQLLELRVQKEKLVKELDNARAPGPAEQKPEAVQPPLPQNIMRDTDTGMRDRVELPGVAEITGSRGSLSALIVSGNGAQVYARPGDRVPGGLRVATIDTRGVTFERDYGGDDNWFVGLGLPPASQDMDYEPVGMAPIPLQ